MPTPLLITDILLDGPFKYKVKQLRAEAEDLLIEKSDAKIHEDQEIDPGSRMRKV